MATELKQGDLIQIYGPLGYQHWAVYVGDGDVIHLGPVSGRANAGASSGRSCCAGSVTQNVAKVMREKLKDVVGKDKYSINNLLDDQRKPRPIKDILKEANSLVGGIRPLNLPSHNCEHFVLVLRYRTSESDQVLKIGDLIEIHRPIRLYQHWAVYVGDGDVIHLGPVSDNAKAVSSSVSPVGQDKGKVKREKLKDVAGKDKYSINNHLDDQYESNSIEDILKEANNHVGKTVPYNVLKKNCEHFVTGLRYGTEESLQVQQAMKTAGAVAICYYIPAGSIPSADLAMLITDWAASGISFMRATKKNKK